MQESAAASSQFWWTRSAGRRGNDRDLIFVVFIGASERERLGDVSDTPESGCSPPSSCSSSSSIWGYSALFEAFWNGQTPGKRLFNIRVIKDSGRQITLFEALARNLLRVVDMFPPPVYFVGLVSMLCNRQQKRLGDFVAGTIVIHERASEQPRLEITAAALPPPSTSRPRLSLYQRPAGFNFPPMR